MKQLMDCSCILIKMLKAKRLKLLYIYYIFIIPPPRGMRQEYWQKYSCTSFAQAAPWIPYERNPAHYLAAEPHATTPSTTQNNLAIIHRIRDVLRWIWTPYCTQTLRTVFTAGHVTPALICKVNLYVNFQHSLLWAEAGTIRLIKCIWNNIVIRWSIGPCDPFDRLRINSA